MANSSPRRWPVFGLWLVLLPAYGVLNLVLPVAVRWAREPGWDAQGLAIEMGCLMASYAPLSASGRRWRFGRRRGRRDGPSL